jgi:hypothetical protein
MKQKNHGLEASLGYTVRLYLKKKRKKERKKDYLGCEKHSFILPALHSLLCVFLPWIFCYPLASKTTLQRLMGYVKNEASLAPLRLSKQKNETLPQLTPQLSYLVKACQLCFGKSLN